MSIRENQINLEAKLFLINTKVSKERIYVWERLLNPIDLKSIKKERSQKLDK